MPRDSALSSQTPLGFDVSLFLLATHFFSTWLFSKSELCGLGNFLCPAWGCYYT